MCILELSLKVLSSFMIIKRKTLKFKSRVRIVFENPAIRSGPLSKLSTEISEGKVEMVVELVRSVGKHPVSKAWQ